MEITEIKLFQCFDNFGTSFNDQNFYNPLDYDMNLLLFIFVYIQNL